MIRSIVVLPQPDGPRTASDLAAGTSRSTPSSTAVRPKALVDPAQRQGAHRAAPSGATWRLSIQVAGTETSTSSSGVRRGGAVLHRGDFDQNSVARVVVPVGESSSVAVSSVETARKTRAAPAPSPGAIIGSVTRHRVAQPALTQAARDVLQHRRGVLEARADADHRPGQEQHRRSRPPAAAAVW